MVEVIFVGTGAAVTAPGRTNTILLARDATTTIMIDCGPTAYFQLDNLRIDPMSVQYLVLTHRHGDHILGFPILFLCRARRLADQPLHVVAGTTTRREVEVVVRSVYPELAQSLDQVQWIVVPEETLLRTELPGGVSLTTAPVRGPEATPTLGVRLDFPDGQSLTYSSDTAPSDRVARLAQGTHLLIHESNFSRQLSPTVDSAEYSHSTARHAGEVAKAAGAKLLALVHLSAEYAGREEQVAQEARQVFDGPVIVPGDGAGLYLYPSTHS